MKFEAKVVEEIYASKVAKRYDHAVPPLFSVWKKRAFNESSLKKGDRVIVFCCGTGLDFGHIIKIIGKEGRIVGVDFSSQMLNLAQKKITKNKWDNVELIEADITSFDKRNIKNGMAATTTSKNSNNKLENFTLKNFTLDDMINKKFDVGVCTLGMSIIPNYKAAYENLTAMVKKQGEVIIGDMQLASGRLARLNPVTIHMAKKFGGTFDGHQNSLEITALMKKELTPVVKREFFFKSYYYCIGKKA